MKKFKKLAVLAITIPTLLSNTNISFAMKSPKQCKSTKKQNNERKQDQNIRKWTRRISEEYGFYAPEDGKSFMF